VSGDIGAPEHRFKFSYDHSGRLLRAYHQLNTEPEVLLSEGVYNELGQALTTRYHSRDNGSSWLYQNNRQYTLQGKLKQLAITSRPAAAPSSARSCPTISP